MTFQQVKGVLRVTCQEDNVVHVRNFQQMDFKNLTV